MSNHNAIDYEKCYASICESKGIPYSVGGMRRYRSAMTSSYHAVCLDIDDTVTYSNKEEMKMVISSLAKLTKRNIIICFITGRGKSNALDFLYDLKSAILSYDSTIHERQFCRWYCITNNGYTLYCHDFLNDRGFLEKGVCFVEPALRKNYLKLKPLLQIKVAEYLAEKLPYDFNSIIKESNASIGDNSLRFPFPREYEEQFSDEMIKEIRDLVLNYTELEFGVNRGIYQKKNKAVIEISMTTKGRAIEQFEHYLGIPKNKMVRIGDQGDYAGNDYEMLNSSCGFSVNRYSTSPVACWPVVKDLVYDEVILTGVKATVELLNSLKLFPTLCLENPNRSIYLPRLAMSENKNIMANHNTYEYYQEMLRYAMNSQRIFNTWDYIDEQTGGFYIRDSEYELLKATNPNHILFSIYDTFLKSHEHKEPRLKFALRTDSGLLLRGPFNYYYGLAFRNESCSNITVNFVRRLNNNRINFFNICLRVLKKENNIDVRDSVVRRVLLGVMDSIRDYLLILINIHLQEHVEHVDKLYFYGNSDKVLFKLYEFAKQNLIYMYNCLFNNIDSKFISHFVTFITDCILPVARQSDMYFQGLENYDFKKGCRVWREIDSFYENTIAVDTAINKMLYDCDIEDRELLFYGIRYGSIELPIIAAMLLDVKYKYFNVNYHVGTLSMKSNYKSNHEKSLDTHRTLKSSNRRGLEDEKYFHILMDDNLLTGRTLQIAVNMLVNRGIYPEKIVVVRYPAINRVEHMFLPGHGAPDPDLFWEYVYGLTSPTPYSKLNFPGSYKKIPSDNYLDALGEFNKTRTYVLNLLYKNGLYTDSGEVSEKGD